MDAAEGMEIEVVERTRDKARHAPKTRPRRPF